MVQGCFEWVAEGKVLGDVAAAPVADGGLLFEPGLAELFVCVRFAWVHAVGSCLGIPVQAARYQACLGGSMGSCVFSYES